MGMINLYPTPVAATFGLSRSSGFTTLTINETAGQTGVATLFMAPLAGATSKITKVCLCVDSKTGTPTFRISIQGVTTGGAPDGVIKSGSGSNDVYVDYSPAAAGHSGWLTLGGGGYSPAQGEHLAVVVQGATADGSNYAAIGYCVSSGAYTSSPMPMNKSGGTWTQVPNYTPAVGVKCANGTIPRGMTPFSSLGSVASWVASSTPLLRGTKWVPPVDCRLVGFLLLARPQLTTDFTIGVVTGTPAGGFAAGESVSVDTSKLYFSASPGVHEIIIPITPYTLSAGATYRFCIQPTTAVAWNGLNVMVCPDMDAMRSMYGDLCATVAGETTDHWHDYDDTGLGCAMYPIVPIIDQISVSGRRPILQRWGA